MTWSNADNSHSRLNHAWSVESESKLLSQTELLYSLDQTLLDLCRLYHTHVQSTNWTCIARLAADKNCSLLHVWWYILSYWDEWRGLYLQAMPTIAVSMVTCIKLSISIIEIQFLVGYKMLHDEWIQHKFTTKIQSEHSNPFMCSSGIHSQSVSYIMSYLLASSTSTLIQPSIYIPFAPWYL